MDNNSNPPENSEGKKNFNNNNKNNFRRRRNQQKPQRDGDDSSPNGSITVKPGRYDLPPEAEQSQSPRPERRDNQNQNKPRQKPETRSDEQSDSSPKRSQQNQKRRPHGRRKNNRDQREVSGNLSNEEITEITEEENAISEYIEVTAPAEGSPSEAEVFEELNSAASADEVPGSEPELQTAQSLDTAELPEPEPLPTFEIVGVRFKANGKIYYFDPDGHSLRRMDSVIVDTARGLEFGTVDVGNRMVTEREVVLPLRKVVRRATQDDIARSEANAARAAEAFAVCGEKIAEHKLEMKLVDVEYTFDNSKLLFYFTAEGRVDFRELVKDLASVFRTRIELRQIGIRDETKLLGGIGICGRPFCCKTFLSDFVQVSIKMAKEQNLSLNSAKISGACGRLMCCLRYEYDTYAEEIRKTPKVDQIVSTPDGDGTVIEVQPLAGLCRVRFTGRPDTPPKVFHRDQLKVIGGKGVKKPAVQEEKPEKSEPAPEN